MPKVLVHGNAAGRDTYASVAEYVKENPDFVNLETKKPPTDKEVAEGEVMTSHKDDIGEGHTLTAVKDGGRRRRKTRRGKKARRSTRKSRR